MDKIRYNTSDTSILINVISKVIDGADKESIREYLDQNEANIKVLLRKVKLRLKKGELNIEQKELLLKYSDYIKEYLDIIDDINLFLEDSIDIDEIQEKVLKLKELNLSLQDINRKLQTYISPPTPVTERLPNRDDFDPSASTDGASIKLIVVKPEELENEVDNSYSLELLRSSFAPRYKKKLLDHQYEKLKNKLIEAGVNLSDIELKKLADAGFSQRINMKVMAKIFETLEDVILNYGETFCERLKLILQLIASNYLFMYDISYFYNIFEDFRTDLTEKVVSTLSAGLSIIEYLGSLMKVVEIGHLEESDSMEGATIIGDLEIPYSEWIKINELEIDLRYAIRDYWQDWFQVSNISYDDSDEDEMIDEDAEAFFEKLIFMELKIERLPYALDSPWELASWIKELFSIMREYGLKHQRWSKLKKAEILMGTFNMIEQSISDPNLYNPLKGENFLLKIGHKVEFSQNNMLSLLSNTVNDINNLWGKYSFSQTIDYLDRSILERSLIAMTFTQTAIEQIELFNKNKNMLDLLFCTQLLSIANEIYTMGMVCRDLPMENSNLKKFLKAFLNFHLGLGNQEIFYQSSLWLFNLSNLLSASYKLIKEYNDEDTEMNVVHFFIQKSVLDFSQGLNDLQMYQATEFRLYLLTSIYSIIQGTNRLMILKNLQEKYFPDEENYEYFNVISEVLNAL